MTHSIQQGEAGIAAHPSTPSKPKPWAAAILSFLIPGLGHQYAGLYRRAAQLVFLFPAAEAAAFVLIVLLPVPPVNVIAPLVLVVVLRGVAGAWTARDARSANGGAARGRLRRWYGLIATAVLVRAVVYPVWGYAYRTTLVEAYKFPTASMESTVLRGDHVLVARWTYGWRVPLLRGLVLGNRPAKRGDLAIFASPVDEARSSLKRVIGLPGETVAIRGKQVFIDGRPLHEPYARFDPPGGGDDVAFLDDWGPYAVPFASYFVLGDNRDNSRDSRFLGFIPQTDLLGCARVVYWSADPDTGQVRWKRIGLLLE